MKRFGRNQKRAMRAKVDELTVKLNAANELEALLRYNMRSNQEAVEATAAILGEHFAGLSPKTEPVLNFREVYQYHRRESVLYDPNAEVAETVMLDLIRLEENKAQLREVAGAIHMHYRTPMGDVAYGLSDDAWRRLPDRVLYERLAHEIARDMARLLVKQRNAKVVP